MNLEAQIGLLSVSRTLLQVCPHSLNDTLGTAALSGRRRRKRIKIPPTTLIAVRMVNKVIRVDSSNSDWPLRRTNSIKLPIMRLDWKNSQKMAVFRVIEFSSEHSLSMTPCAVHKTAAPIPIITEVRYSDHSNGYINDATYRLKIQYTVDCRL